MAILEYDPTVCTMARFLDVVYECKVPDNERAIVRKAINATGPNETVQRCENKLRLQGKTGLARQLAKLWKDIRFKYNALGMHSLDKPKN